MTSFQ